MNKKFRPASDSKTAVKFFILFAVLAFLNFDPQYSPAQAQTLAWTQLTPSGSPPGLRSSHSGVYDSANNKLIVFGGAVNTFGGTTNSVFVLSNASGVGGTPTWTPLSPAGTPPSARVSHTAVYDPTTNRMIVFGGSDSTGKINDLWVLANANGSGGTPTWIQLSPAGGPPPERDSHSAVYDPSTNIMIVFGGNPSSGPLLNDAWILTDANGLGGTPTWTQLSPTGGPPAARIGHTAVYDSSTNRMIVFGGAGSGTLNDLWILTNANGQGGTPSWVAPSMSGTPPALWEHSAVYDETTNTMLIFGGVACCWTGAGFNDVWRVSNANANGALPTWTQLSPSGGPPAGRFFHTAIHDRTTDRMIVFGGFRGGCCLFGDVWVLENAIPVLVVPPPVISVTPNSLGFGNAPVGTSKDLAFTVQNTGGGTLTGNATTSAPFSIVGDNSFSLGANESTTITVRFSPTSAGIFNGNVNFTSNGGDASPLVGGVGVIVATNKPPQIKAISPAAATPGDVITLSGQNFGLTNGKLSVGGQTATPLSWNDTFIQFVLPDLVPGNHNIEVVTSGGRSRKVIKVLPPGPKIDVIRPPSGPPGSTVLIDGHNFGTTQGTSNVKVGGIVSEVVFWGDKRVEIKIPPLTPGSYPLVLHTQSGEAKGTFRVRLLILVPEYGQCDDSFFGTLSGDCRVIVPTVTKVTQGANGTQVDIMVENIRQAWYEVTITAAGTSISGPNPFIIGPGEKRKIINVSVGPGTAISFFADGRSNTALGILGLYLLVRAATGRPLPLSNLDAALFLLSEGSPLAGFFGNLTAHIASKNVVAILSDLRSLPGLAANDPVIQGALKTALHLSKQQIVRLGDLGLLVRLTSVIQQELLTLTAPSFDSASLVAR